MTPRNNPYAPLKRQDLTELAARQLRNLIVVGRLAPGTPLVERDVSTQLGVSRTPLREALAELLREGLVTTRGVRGLQVAPLDPDEVKQIYPVIAALEQCALADAPPLTDRQLEEMRHTNEKFSGAREDPTARAALDDRWHRLLMAACENHIAGELLVPLKRRARRYELTYLADSELVRHSAEEHASVHAALARGDAEEAATKLAAHWLGSIEPMLAAIARSSLH